MGNFERPAEIASEALIPCRNLWRRGARQRIGPRVEHRIAVLIVQAEMDLVGALAQHPLHAEKSGNATWRDPAAGPSSAPSSAARLRSPREAKIHSWSTAAGTAA